MNVSIRQTREEIADELSRRSAERHLAERRMQLSMLLLLAAAILLGTVLYAGAGNVFLPGWWRLW